MYRLLYTDEARKQIQKLSRKTQEKIREAIEQIAVDPFLGKSLTHDLKGRWSFRVGDYRIIYRVYQEQIQVLILTVGHRRYVYEKEARKIR